MPDGLSHGPLLCSGSMHVPVHVHMPVLDRLRRCSLRIIVHRQSLPYLGPLAVASGKRIHHHRRHGSHHGDHPRDREVPPLPVPDARRRQPLEGVGEDVYQPRGQDDPRRKRLDDEERIALRIQRLYPPPEDRNQDTEAAGGEDGGNGGELQREGAFPGRRARRAVAGGEREERERESEE